MPGKVGYASPRRALNNSLAVFTILFSKINTNKGDESILYKDDISLIHQTAIMILYYY